MHRIIAQAAQRRTTTALHRQRDYYYEDRCLAILQERGTTALRHPEEWDDAEGHHRVFCFSSPHVGGKLSTFAHFILRPTAPETFFEFGFTTGDPFLNDNFDQDPRRGALRVENCAFGAAKLLVELAEIEAFIREPRRYVREVDYAPFVKEADRVVVCPSSSSPNDNKAQDEWLTELLISRMDAMCEKIRGHRRKTPPTKWIDDGESAILIRRIMDQEEEAPAAQLREQARLAFAGHDTTLPISSSSAEEPGELHIAAAIFQTYRARRLELLQPTPDGRVPIVDCNPRVAKLIVGQTTLPPFQAPWTNRSQAIADWAVFLARRFFLACSPDLAYPFCLVYSHAQYASELSDNDRVWAYELKTDGTNAKGPIDRLLFFLSADERAETLRAIRGHANDAKLGVVNARVARSLLGLEFNPVVPAENDRLNRQFEHAQRYLARCGWVDWFDRNIARSLYPDRPSWGVLSVPLLDEGFKAAIRHSTIDDLQAFMLRLNHALAPIDPPLVA